MGAVHCRGQLAASAQMHTGSHLEAEWTLRWLSESHPCSVHGMPFLPQRLSTALSLYGIMQEDCMASSLIRSRWIHGVDARSLLDGGSISLGPEWGLNKPGIEGLPHRSVR